MISFLFRGVPLVLTTERVGDGYRVIHEDHVSVEVCGKREVYRPQCIPTGDSEADAGARWLLSLGRDFLRRARGPGTVNSEAAFYRLASDAFDAIPNYRVRSLLSEAIDRLDEHGLDLFAGGKAR